MENQELIPTTVKEEIIVANSEGIVLDEFDVHALKDAKSTFVMAFAEGYKLDDIAIFNAVQSPTKPVSDSVGDEFNLIGVVAHGVHVTNEAGEPVACPRIILIGSKGESYVSVSKTMFTSLKNLFALYKTPEQWDKNGVPVKLKQFNKNNKRYFSLELITPKK